MHSTPNIPAGRDAEYEALVGLLMEHASKTDPRAKDVAQWIARASLEPGHLWRAMGLGDRAELRTLFETHFAKLAAGNTKDMRWKRYLYKRLCGWPGFDG